MKNQLGEGLDGCTNRCMDDWMSVGINGWIKE